MENLKIIEYYTTPKYDFELANSLLDLIEATVDKEILAKYAFPKMKSKTLEIMLDAEIKIDKRKVKQLSKTGRGQYFSFAFWLPYQIIVQNSKINISIFISEFMEALRTSLSQFNLIPDELIDQLKDRLITETEGKNEYVTSPEEESIWQIVDEVSRQFEAGELI